MKVIAIPILDVANSFIMKLLNRLDNYMLDFIWFKGMVRKGDYLWDDMVPVAMALGAVFSLIVVGKLAYKAMVLEENIDFMKLWKPIAMALVISNWYVVTYSIFSLTQPFEDYFREGFYAKNAEIIALQDLRVESVNKLAEMNRAKAGESIMGDQMEEHALTRKDVSGREVSVNEDEINDIIISTYGESYLDMNPMPKDENGEELPKLDSTDEIKSVAVQSIMERVFIWIAEVIWSCAVLFIFLVRAFFLTVLVLFGPVYMAASILPAWEDAWKEWLERYIPICFLGAAAFLGLIFASHIIIWGLKNDTANWQQFVSSEKAWYEWLAHVIWRFICSIGLYITALFTATGVIGATFELATYFFPSKMIHGAAQMYQGLWNTGKITVHTAERYTEEKTKQAVRSGAGSVQAHYIEKNEDKARESLDMGTSMGPEGKMKDGKTTGEFQKRTNTYQDHQNSSAQKQAQSTYAAHRWADRLWQQKLAGSKNAAHFKTKDRMAAARQDLEEYLKAQSEGRAEQFLKEHNERMRENRILLSIVTTGRVGLHLFGGSVKERDQFLKKHGLYEAFKRAEKLETNAEKMDEKELQHNIRKKKVYEAREGTAGRIFDLISTSAAEILAARGIVLDFSIFDDIDDGELKNEIGGTAKDTSGASGTDMDKSAAAGKKRAWERLFDNEGENDDYWDEAQSTGTYRMKVTDEGYDNVQEQMQQPWFRKLAANKYNRMLLMHTLQAYERALKEGRGEQFIRDMQYFGAWTREGLDDEEAVHPFTNVHMDKDEFVGMWGKLRNTEKLRKVNEALDAIERANDKNEEENNKEE